MQGLLFPEPEPERTPCKYTMQCGGTVTGRWSFMLFGGGGGGGGSGRYTIEHKMQSWPRSPHHAPIAFDMIVDFKAIEDRIFAMLTNKGVVHDEIMATVGRRAK